MDNSDKKSQHSLLNINDERLQELAKKIVTISFRNCMAYTRAVETEDMCDRIERIGKAMNQIQQKELATEEYVRTHPQMLD